MRPMISSCNGVYRLEKYIGQFKPYSWWKNLSDSEYAKSKNFSLSLMLEPWNGGDPNDYNDHLRSSYTYVEFSSETDLTMFLLKWG